MASRSEQLRLVKRALRNVRRQFRKADTSGEVLERWLDRQILRKTPTTRTQADKIMPLWETYRNATVAIESAVTDFLSAATDTMLG